MQVVTRSSLAATLIIILTLNYAFGYMGSAKRRIEGMQDNDADSWVERNYTTVLNNLLPDGVIAPEKFPKQVKWMVTARILPPFERPEYRFSMHKTYDGKVEASITATKGISIASQLRALKNKYPEATLEKISTLVSVEHRTIRQSECPPLSRLADQFEAINMSPVLSDELGVDETGYEFWSQSLWGNRMNISLSGPGPEAKKQTHPLLQWAETVRSRIAVCAKS